MTEHFNAGQEGQSVDKTVSRLGNEEWSEIGIRCRWELHSLPEYVNDDEVLSVACSEKVLPLLIERGLKDAVVSLVEGYSDEDAGKEHYRFVMTFGEGCNNKKFTYLKEYLAVTEDGEVNGVVRSTVCLPVESEDEHLDMVKQVADVYIKDMEETYTDWQNQWSEGHFIVAK